MAARSVDKQIKLCGHWVRNLFFLIIGLMACASTARSENSSIYDLDRELNFNVLDRVEYNPNTKQILLFGHADRNYEKNSSYRFLNLPYLNSLLENHTSKIPYLQFLATLLDNSSPEFSLEWTKDSKARVDNWLQGLDSDDVWKELVRDWGNWIDESGKLSPNGKIFLPMFGIRPPESADANEPWQGMDRYQVLSAVFAVAGNESGSKIIDAFGRLVKQGQNLEQ